MKNFPLLLFFALTFAFAASAQTNQNLSCPSFYVTGGEEIAEPGETLTFTAKIENYDLSKLSFVWTVSSGEILEGQGTLSIKVLKKDDGKSITAVISITGLPQSCASEAYETEPICSCTSPRLLDEFSISEMRIDKARLDNFVSMLQREPNAQFYIVEYFKPKTTKKVIDRKTQKIRDYLVYEKLFAKERFTILTADSENKQNRTKFWIVPPGARMPQP